MNDSMPNATNKAVLHLHAKMNQQENSNANFPYIRALIAWSGCGIRQTLTSMNKKRSKHAWL